MFSGSVYAKCFECGKHDEHGRPSVVKREGEVDKELVSDALGLVIFLDDIVNVLQNVQTELVAGVC